MNNIYNAEVIEINAPTDSPHWDHTASALFKIEGSVIWGFLGEWNSSNPIFSKGDIVNINVDFDFYKDFSKSGTKKKSIETIEDLPQWHYLISGKILNVLPTNDNSNVNNIQIDCGIIFTARIRKEFDLNKNDYIEGICCINVKKQS